jgi:hypothetical protein
MHRTAITKTDLLSKGTHAAVRGCQIKLHVAPGALRVRVLDAVDGPPVPADALAWHTDLVITTFQRLSNERRGGRPEASPFMQARMHLPGKSARVCSQHATHRTLSETLLSTALSIAAMVVCVRGKAHGGHCHVCLMHSLSDTGFVCE